MPSTVPTTSEFNDLVLQVNIIKDAIAKLDERLKKLEGSTTPPTPIPPTPTPIPPEPIPPEPTPTPPPTTNTTLPPIPPASKTTNVTTLGALAAAVLAAQKDEYVILADGTYNNTTPITLKNTAGNRVIIKAATTGKAIINGQPLHLGSKDLILQGFDLAFDKTGDYMDIGGSADNCRITRCKLHFANHDDSKWLAIGGADFLMDHCEMFNKTTMDTMITDQDSSAPRPRILYNYFHDFIHTQATPCECIRIGQSGLHNVDFNGEIAYNRFEKISADIELCTWKCKNLNIHHNTMVDCDSAHTFRHGSLKKFNDNICINSGGLRFYGAGNEVKGNQIISSNRGQIKGPLTIGSGDGEVDGGGASYARVKDNTIQNNIVIQNTGSSSSLSAIYLGYGDKGFPPLANLIKENIVVASTGLATKRGAGAKWEDQKEVKGNILQISGTGQTGDMPISGYTKTDAKLIKKPDGTYDFSTDSPLKWTQTIKYLRPEDVGINAP